MCKEMSTGFFFFCLWSGWSVVRIGDGRGEMQFSHGEKEYLPTFHENTYLPWPFCSIKLEHDFFTFFQKSPCLTGS